MNFKIITKKRTLSIGSEGVSKIEEDSQYLNSPKLPNTSINDLFEIKIKHDFVKRMEIEYTHSDEFAFIIEKYYWDTLKINDDNINEFLESSNAIPIAIPKPNSTKSKYIINYFDFKRISNKAPSSEEYSFYLVSLKINPEQKLGLTLISDKAKKNDVKEKKVAIFIHGIASEVGDNFSGLYECLKNDFQIFAYNYNSISEGIEENGILFKQYLQKFKGKTVHIFSHSMGGLVSRAAIHKGANIDTLVMAGTPNNGAILSERVRGIIYPSKLLRKLIVGSLKGMFHFTPKDIYYIKENLVPGLEDLSPDSNIIDHLNKYESNTNKYFVLAGHLASLNHDGIVKVKSMTEIKSITLKYSKMPFCLHTYYYKSTSKLQSHILKARSYLKI
ncbi:hypothetical protein MKY51_14435 [Solibacillus sp. FSL R5-0691]|uniref:lipase family alpha/beta hydrolase n=1 Tax=Solibacillus sp. FSL R5-0691 TaxID=2921653 RepID=UPI0030D4A4E5